jgi:hypothetical protein
MFSMTKTAAAKPASDPLPDSGREVLRRTVFNWSRTPTALAKLSVEVGAGLEALASFARGESPKLADNVLSNLARVLLSAEYLPDQDKLRSLPPKLPAGMLAAHPAPRIQAPYKPVTELQRRLAQVFRPPGREVEGNASRHRCSPSLSSSYERTPGWVDTF